jgi:HK97 gp10 family phage protein
MAQVKVEGLRELEQALSELPKATARNTLVRTLKKGAEHVRDVWAPNAPKLTGTLQHSIIAGPSSKLTGRQKRDAKRDGKFFAEYHVGTSDPAGQMNEFGTSKMAAQPSGRPAWEITQESVLEEISTDLAQEIEKARARLARKAARLAGG